jgi:excisionase family DNA binding protein
MARMVEPQFERSMEAGEGNDVISISQACQFLGVHRNTLYRLIHEEALPAFRMTRGGRWRFRKEDLRDWLEDKQGARRG